MDEHSRVISTSLDSSQLQQLEQLDDEGFWDYVRELAHQVPTAATAKAQGEEYLECTLSRGQCLIPLTTLFQLVLPPHRLALLPATPEWMPGIVAWRGETIAVIDLDMYLSGHEADLTNGMLLIANHQGLPIGLLVSGVGQTRSIEQGTIEKPFVTEDVTDPDQGTRQGYPYHGREPLIHGRGTPGGYPEGREALILDVSSLLADVVRQIEIAASNG